MTVGVDDEREEVAEVGSAGGLELRGELVAGSRQADIDVSSRSGALEGAPGAGSFALE